MKRLGRLQALARTLPWQASATMRTRLCLLRGPKGSTMDFFCRSCRRPISFYGSRWFQSGFGGGEVLAGASALAVCDAAGTAGWDVDVDADGLSSLAFGWVGFGSLAFGLATRE